MTAHRALPNFGCQQSPIDFLKARAFQTPDLEVQLTWTHLSLSYAHDRKFQVAQADGNLELDGEPYVPVDLHWHLPAEHTEGDLRHPAEVHIVHVHAEDVEMAGKGELDWLRIAVVGVFIEQGDARYEPFAAILDVKPAEGEEKKVVAIGRSDILPTEALAYRYCGGLTTPPYSENVTFVILRAPRTATAEQLKDGGAPNARPLQDVNRRVVAIGDVGGLDDNA